MKENVFGLDVNIVSREVADEDAKHRPVYHAVLRVTDYDGLAVPEAIRKRRLLVR